jgi:putative ABC transport system permease protein
MGKGEWKVAGLFEAGETAFNSEIWMDYKELMQEFDRNEYNTVVLRAQDAAAVLSLQDLVKNDRRVKMTAKTEKKYYEEQTSSAAPLKAFGLFLAVMMAIGACFAGMNTMYASVSGRTREIGTLRILGYAPRAILLCFLIESVLLALIGGALGCAVALGLTKLLNYAPVGTANFVTFSEVVFFFAVTPKLAALGMAFALAMGVLGGLAPAINAARRPILDALRQA